ncbi:hypothetical protein [Roseinatronobacter alkalisoli]|uniref:Uncharacterized protein n=1 Tax=Roseinatronobacter alkalisoli TaxID=3028235 RepID=A0ABT5TAP6_9RHOB|nr:hypothetical protein [Roseinatronobacter sp. HJB301]MDD7972191.1 hypothetical protein [Roseinatronobacter sp. HJB301]
MSNAPIDDHTATLIRNAPLSGLEHVFACNKRAGRSVVDFFVVKMLADLMVRLVMTAERITNAEIQQLRARANRVACANQSDTRNGSEAQWRRDRADVGAVQRAENEGMPPRQTPSRDAEPVGPPPVENAVPPLGALGPKSSDVA